MVALTPGSVLSDRVRLVRPLAQGGMGEVWLAENVSLNTKVAVKFMSRDFALRDASMRSRFVREARINAQIASIHVVQVFDLGRMSDGTPYIVMELLEGRSLTERIESEGPLTVRQVGVIVSQVCRALHAAHEQGIVHRDIKPDNIYLIDSDYEVFVKLLDFGIAKQMRAPAEAGAVTRTGMVVGTPEFMSPEQAVSSKDIDARTDLYSLAVVAYYALSGELPFDPEGAEPLWMQMANGRYTPIAERVSSLPAGLADWFARALEAKPKNRFQSAREMARALGEVLAPEALEMMDELAHVGAPRPHEPLGAHITRVRGSRSEPLDDFDGPATLVMDEDRHDSSEPPRSSAPGASEPPEGDGPDIEPSAPAPPARLASQAGAPPVPPPRPEMPSAAEPVVAEREALARPHRPRRWPLLAALVAMAALGYAVMMML